MIVYGRDGRLGPRLKHLFQGTFRNPESNRLTGVYEMVLKRGIEGSPSWGILEHGQTPADPDKLLADSLQFNFRSLIHNIRPKDDQTVW